MLRFSKQRTILRASLFGCLIAAIVATALCFINQNTGDSSAATKDGETVTVTYRADIGIIEYGNGQTETNWYQIVNSSNETFDAFCAEPSKNNPIGVKTATRIPSGSQEKPIKLLIYLWKYNNSTTAPIRSTIFDPIKNDSNWGDSEIERLYAYTHAVIGAIYSEDYLGLYQSMINQVNSTRSLLNSLISDNAPAWQQAQNFALFYANSPATAGDQDVVWMEATGSITVQKCDAEITNTCIAQGNANFDGITFTLYNGSTAVATKTLSGGAKSVTFNDLDLTKTYTIRESGSNPNYNVNASSQTATPTASGTTVTFRNTIKRGKLTVNKIDKDTGSCTNSGALSFAGTTFQLINNSANSVYYQNNTIAKGGVVTTKTLADNECNFTIDNLPYGSYIIKETAAATGYVLDNSPKTINIPTNNNPNVTFTFENQPIRGDVKFVKMDKDNGVTMSNTIFSISSLDKNYNIKETHIVVANQNGIVDTSANPHSFNTNGYDEPYNDFIEEQIVYLGYGTWFGLDENGDKIAVKDNLGALPYGTYLIQELKCDANMFCTDIINQKKTIQITQHGTVVDLGNWDNTCTKFTIETEATDASDGDKYIEASSNSTIKDKVSYCVKKNVSFTIKGVLMKKSTGEKLLINGQPVEQSVEVKPTEDCGEVELNFNIDSSALAGEEIVAFEYLYYKDNLVAQHEDINDEGQTVNIISLRTFAVNQENNEKVLPYDAETTIKDEVYYCLKTNQEYTLKGVVMRKDTREKLLINGEPVEQEITFTPEQTCGRTEMYFSVNTTDLAGVDLVIFEDLFLDDQLIISHKDFNNEYETVSVAPIPTPNTGSASEDSKGITNASSPWLIGAAIIIVPISIHLASRFYRQKRFLHK